MSYTTYLNEEGWAFHDFYYSMWFLWIFSWLANIVVFWWYLSSLFETGMGMGPILQAWAKDHWKGITLLYVLMIGSPKTTSFFFSGSPLPLLNESLFSCPILPSWKKDLSSAHAMTAGMLMDVPMLSMSLVLLHHGPKPSNPFLTIPMVMSILSLLPTFMLWCAGFDMVDRLNDKEKAMVEKYSTHDRLSNVQPPRKRDDEEADAGGLLNSGWEEKKEDSDDGDNPYSLQAD